MGRYPNDGALCEKLKNHEKYLLDLGEGKVPANATVDGYILVDRGGV